MLRVMPGTTELEALITRLAAIDYSQGSEQATREMAVNPVIGALGWDTFDPNEVAREYSVRGGRVDYCLRGQDRNLVLIEVKKAETDLTEHQEQLLRYAFDEGVPLAALTDGLVWWLYLPMAGGSWEQRRFFRIDFRDQDAHGAASALDRFLNRDASVTGAALGEAQHEFESQERDRRVRAALEDAWQQVLGDPDGLLRDLLAETVEEISGHRPDEETVAGFLRGIAVGGSAEPGLPARPHNLTNRGPRRRAASTDSRTGRPVPRVEPPSPGELAVAPDPASFAGRRPAAFWLDGGRYEVSSWPQLVQTLSNQLAGEVGPAFAERVASVRGRTRLYFSEQPADLRHARQVANSRLYVEGNLGPDSAARIARRVLQAVRGTDDGFRIELSDSTDRMEPASSAAEPELASFTGRSPAAFWLDGSRHEVARWRAVLQGVCGLMAADSGLGFGDRVAHLRGRTRPYFSREPGDLFRAVSIEGSDWFVEGNLSANDCVRVARQTLTAVRGTDDGFRIELAE